MDEKTSVLGLKAIIWFCLAAIIFSPLYVSTGLFFPFITSKTVVFQIAVEVMMAAFLVLCWVDEKYRIKSNITVYLILGYLVVLTIASLFSGNDFYHSFWSNNERSDGILLLGHLFLFTVVLTSFLRTVKEWLYVFDMFLAAAFCVALVSLDQYLALAFPSSWTAHIMPSSGGQRLASTIGNAGYVGGYMVFGFFTAVYLFFKAKAETFTSSYWWLVGVNALILFLVGIIFTTKAFFLVAVILAVIQSGAYLLRKTYGWQIYYAALALFFIFIAIETQTRGAYLALAFGLGIMAVYLMWFYYQNRYLKIALVVSSAIMIAAISSIFIFKHTDFVQNQPILNRISSISLADNTGSNRLITWGIGYKGFWDRPLLGYGQENFYQVFDKYYYTKNTEQWFDRCHDMICDRAITGGIIGLISYLALLLVPFWAIWQYYRKEYADKAEIGENLSRRYLTPILFSILIVAYIIQNLFIFEALVTYVPLILVLSFVGLFNRGLDNDIFEKESFKSAAAVIGLIVLLPAIWIFNWQPIAANADFIKVLSSENMAVSNRIDAFEEVISRGTMGNQEYRKHYYTSFYEPLINKFLSESSGRTQEQTELLASFSAKMQQQMEDEVRENPYSVSNYLLLIRFYNMSYPFDPSRLQKAIALAPQAIALSPGRPQIYYEAGSSNYYYAQMLLSDKDESGAKEQFRQSVTKFFQGAALSNTAADKLNGLLGYWTSVLSNQSGDVLAQACVEDKIAGRNAPEITAEVISWYDQFKAAATPSDKDTLEGFRSSIVTVLEKLSKAAPNNAALASQLASLK